MNTAFQAGRTFDTREFGNRCPQDLMIGAQKTAISEDCLYLNIWIPQKILSKAEEGSTFKLTTSESLPVMIFIHGGGFTIGSGDDPYIKNSKFNDNGIILISFNYRLGLFGFFPVHDITKDNPLVENLSLLDQRLAILWVIENIHHFGGNPNQITLFGESAGAMSILWHLTANETTIGENERILNNIKQVIIQSAPNIEPPRCDQIGKHLRTSLEIFGCNDFYNDDYIACLRNLDMQTIIDNIPGFFFKKRKLFWHTSAEVPGFGFTPCIGDTIFDQNPRIAFETGSYAKDKNIIIGTCKVCKLQTCKIIHIDKFYFRTKELYLLG